MIRRIVGNAHEKIVNKVATFFIMATFYILYSKSINKYYVGATCDSMTERLRRHNSSHKGFTGRISDWEIIYSENFDTKEDAFAREKEVKSWKSRKKVEQLVQSKEV